MELGDILTAISSSKVDIFKESTDAFPEKSYPAFVVLRCLSYHPDAVFAANDMNMCPALPEKMQFDYLRFMLPARKRWGQKWFKKEKDADVDLLISYYHVNRRRAEKYAKILTEEQIEDIRSRMYQGG